MSVDMNDVEFRQVRPGSEGRMVGATPSSARGETGFIAGFERMVLFRIARFVALAICFVLFLTLVGGLAFIGLSMSGSDAPDVASVVQELRPAPSAPGAPSQAPSYRQGGSHGSALGRQSALVGLRVAPPLQELLGQDGNKAILEDWVSMLDLADRQPFMDGLGQAIAEARKHGVDDAAAVNRYHEHFQAYVVEREAGRLASIEARLYMAGAVVSVLLLLALFSLVLVLLAIERNTYRAANVAYEP